MANKRYYEEKATEARDGGMLNASPGSVANMPQEVKYHAWPTTEKYMGSDNLDDTIKGINAQMGEDVAGAKRHKSHNKY
jgi:predicted enzyme related to lactoylglutathione lyase